MRRYLAFLSIAFLSGLLALGSHGQAHAGAYSSAVAAPLAGPSTDLLYLAGYYGNGGGSDYEDYDGYRYRHKQIYDNDDNGGDGYPDGGCGYGHYKKKYVCDEPYPRCFKQRECVWNYGREYCRYVRKCVGGQQYCRWIKVPVWGCGNGYDGDQD
jgi:hypothetical protein